MLTILLLLTAAVNKMQLSKSNSQSRMCDRRTRGKLKMMSLLLQFGCTQPTPTSNMQICYASLALVSKMGSANKLIYTSGFTPLLIQCLLIRYFTLAVALSSSKINAYCWCNKNQAPRKANMVFPEAGLIEAKTLCTAFRESFSRKLK